MVPQPTPTVAIVEDETDIRETFKAALELLGYRVYDYSNGQEALNSLMRGTKPSLILLDVMMPVMDGLEFLDQCKVHVPWVSEVPVIMVSAVADRIPHRPDVRAQMPKPVDLESLFNVVNTHLSVAPRAA